MFIQADINNPPFGAGTFDFISGLNLLDALKRPLTGLGQMNAMLKRGGRLVLSSPYTWDPEISEDWLEAEDIPPHEYVKQLLTGAILPETRFNYRILSEREGIPWLIRKQDSSHFQYFVDLIAAKKL